MKEVLVISDRDNVATALVPLDAGRTLEVGGLTITATDGIPAGHKVALRAIAAGEPIVKYGSPIGLASAPIQPGAHVHTHNLASSRGRGDLGVPPLEPAARLAEPPDDTAARQGPTVGAGRPVDASPAAGAGTWASRAVGTDE